MESGIINADKAVKKTGLTRKARQNIIGWAFIAPAMLGFFLFLFVPIIIAVLTSFSDFNGNLDSFKITGISNYKFIFTNDATFHFLRSLKNLLLYVVLYVPLNVIISMTLALLVSKTTKINKFFRAGYYIPSLTSGIAVAAVWAWMLNPSMGLINTMLRGIHIPNPPNWLNDPKITMITVTIVTLWGGTAGNMVMYIAAAQGISESLYEAAKIEGAGALRITFKITIPLLRPITYFVMTTVLIGSFQLYDQVIMLYGGNGPSNSAITPVMAIQAPLSGMYYGMASAMSVVLLIIVTVFTFIFQKLNKENYN